MKKRVICTAALLCLTLLPGIDGRPGVLAQTAAAQTSQNTMVTVTLVVEREVVLRGPYARYASQYLGISGAAQSDRESYRILDGAIGYYLTGEGFFGAQRLLLQDGDFPGGQVGSNNPFTDVSLSSLYGTTVERSSLPDEEGFGELPVNRVTTVEKSTEQMAAEAAGAIFTLRKRRFDLVTGELGEGAFGSGMQPALDEMERIENNYLSLFIGKRYTQRIVRTFSVAPQSGGVIVCRFSDTAGIVSDSDLSGQPIVLQFTQASASAQPEEDVAATSGRGKNQPAVTVPSGPALSMVRLLDGTTELDKQVIPVY